MPLRWSRRWYEDPAPGTEVTLVNGPVEIHIGGGVWQTIPRASVGD
jgi:hypothetical protein